MKHLALVFCCLCAVLFGRAQNVVFTAQAAATTVGLEDKFEVSFVLQNINEQPSFDQPIFGSFQVVAGPQQMQNISMSIVGKRQVRSVSVSVVYVLKATRTGTITIPPVTAHDQSGNVYQCNPLTIKVVQGSVARQAQQAPDDPFGGFDPFDDPIFGGGDPFASIRQHQARMQQLLQQMQQQSQGMQRSLQNTDPKNLPEISQKDLGNNLFIRVTVDKTKVRMGEQVTATYKMYTRLPMQAAISKLPSLNGFWTQDFELPKDQKPVLETLNGQQYNTFTLKKSALFPQQTGTLVLDPAEAKGVTSVPDRNNPFGGRDMQFTLKSAPVNITVEALPLAGRPENFGGAVGNFSIKDNLEKTNLSTDETVNLTLTISGSGNLKLIEAPALKLPNGLDAFDPKIIDTITGRSTTISGDKIITYTIAPRVAGDYELPSLEFTYFDPRSNKYVTLHTATHKLHVTKGSGLTAENRTRPVDLEPLLGGKLPQYTVRTLYIRNVFFWLLWLLPALGLSAFIANKKRSDTLAGNEKLFKKKYAGKVAQKRLKTARVFLERKQSAAFYEEISKAVWLYLSDKLHLPLSRLSKETAAEALADKQIPDDLMKRLNAVIGDCEMSLYAPGSAASEKMQQTYDDAASLLSLFEEKLRKS